MTGGFNWPNWQILRSSLAAVLNTEITLGMMLCFDDYVLEAHTLECHKCLKSDNKDLPCLTYE